MKNDQEKRLLRLLVISMMVILGLLSIVIGIIVVELSGVKKDNLSLSTLIQNIQTRDGYTPIKGVDYFDGKDGKDGYTPRKNVDYFDGRDGRDGEDGYTPVKGVDYFDGLPGEKGDKGDQGEKGDTGDTGAPGTTVFTRQNPVTGEYECRYAGDTEWQPESECS